MIEQKNTQLKVTPVWGVKAIADVLNLSPRATYHLLETGRIPARKHGRKWASTVESLEQLFAEIGK